MERKFGQISAASGSQFALITVSAYHASVKTRKGKGKKKKKLHQWLLSEGQPRPCTHVRVRNNKYCARRDVPARRRVFDLLPRGFPLTPHAKGMHQKEKKKGKHVACEVGETLNVEPNIHLKKFFPRGCFWRASPSQEFVFVFLISAQAFDGGAN